MYFARPFPAFPLLLYCIIKPLKLKGRRSMKKYFNFEVLRSFLLGFLTGASPLAMGVYPFGAAFLCGYGGNIYACALGAVVSAFLFGTYRLVTAVSVMYTAAIRALFSKRKNVWWRVLLLSAAYSALLGVTLLSRGYFTADKLVGTLCIILIPPVFALITFFSKANRFFEGVHILALGFVLARAFSGYSLFGVSVSVAAAVFLTALTGKEKGFPLSGAAGFLFGAAGGLSAIPVTGIFGLVHGLFAYDSPLFALILAFMLSVTAGAYILGFDGILPIALAVLTGGVLFLPFLRRKEVAPPLSVPSVRNEKLLSSLAAGFSSLSGLFFTMSDTTLSPPRDTVYRGVKEKLDSVCDSCGGCALDKGDIADFLTTACCEGRRLIPDDLPVSLRKKCRCYRDIVLIPEECINENLSDINQTYSDFAAQYKCFSNMLAASAKKAEEESAEDDTLVPKVEKVLEDNGVYFEKVRVTGVRMRKVEIFGVQPDSIRISSGEFSKLVARAVGRCLCPPEFVCCGEKVTAVFATVPALRTESVKLVTARDGETLSGDTVSMFENGEHCFYSLVADGMGSGREANMVSRLASLYLEKIIGVGGDMNSALLLLGDTLSRSPGETFTTVDMLEADRVLARAKIVKAGAPPSFLLRGGKQYVIKSKTPPLGIIKEVTPQQTSFSLRRGDIILMVSDGVDISPTAIAKSFSGGKDLRASAAALADISRKRGSTDDMSVCAVRFY